MTVEGPEIINSVVLSGLGFTVHGICKQCNNVCCSQAPPKKAGSGLRQPLHRKGLVLQRPGFRTMENVDGIGRNIRKGCM